MVAIDGTELAPSASKIRSVRCDRASELREKLAADIAELTTRAGAADAQAQPDPQSDRLLARRLLRWRVTPSLRYRLLVTQMGPLRRGKASPSLRRPQPRPA